MVLFLIDWFVEEASGPVLLTNHGAKKTTVKQKALRLKNCSKARPYQCTQLLTFLCVTIVFLLVYGIFSGRKTRHGKLQQLGEISSQATHLGENKARHNFCARNLTDWTNRPAEKTRSSTAEVNSDSSRNPN